jgi:hypothetical protein
MRTSAKGWKQWCLQDRQEGRIREVQSEEEERFVPSGKAGTQRTQRTREDTEESLERAKKVATKNTKGTKRNRVVHCHPQAFFCVLCVLCVLCGE